ncbi:MAG: hypothetical protein ABIH41_01555 [Nanoarchaeota archaeon]
MEEDLYVPIQQPTMLRRELLEGSKEIIILLKDYHRIMLIRKQKLDLMEAIKAQLKETIFLIEKFKELVPEKEFPMQHEIIKQALAPPPVVAPKPKPAPAPAPPIVKKDKDEEDLQMLEKALASIEDKLQQLG